MIRLKSRAHAQHSLSSNIWTTSGYGHFPGCLKHLAHAAGTMHCASGSKLCHHTIVWYHTPFLTWHPLIAWLPILSSPLSGGFCHAASATSPPFFLSLRFSLACRQCPFLGTKYWRALNKRTNLSLYPRSRPPPSVFRRSSWTNANL